MELETKSQKRLINKIGFSLAAMVVGVLFLALILFGLTNASASESAAVSVGDDHQWTPVLTETFESGIGPGWIVKDTNGPIDGEYSWVTTSITASEGNNSVWATGNGVDGTLLEPGANEYPAGAFSSISYSGVNLSGTLEARLSFDYWVHSQQDVDVLDIKIDDDVVTTISGDQPFWQNQVIDLSSYNDSISQTVEFLFTSDSSGTGKGVFIDNILLETVTVTDTYIYFPRIMKPPPVVTLNSTGRPNSSNHWTLKWSVSDPSSATGYEIHEDNNINFSSPKVIPVGPSSLKYVVSKSASASNLYFYRVRAKLGQWGTSEWSNVRWTAGNYSDNFSSSSSGWAMRRQDTDGIDNKVYYRNGNLVLEMDSGYDYLLAAPMAPAPSPPYRLEARIRFTGVDNLHGYGIVFGGDWNGSTCPNSRYTSCFNKYYRLTALWYGNETKLKMSLKKIKFHTSDDNTGYGVTLISSKIVNVQRPSDGYQTWRINVYPSGDIYIYVDGAQVGHVVDTQLVDKPYFGAFSTVNEYTGLEAEYDWFKATALN